MAKVEMDLNELKSIENERDKAISELKESKDNFLKVNNDLGAEIIKLQSDKMIVKKTIYKDRSCNYAKYIEIDIELADKLSSLIAERFNIHRTDDGMRHKLIACLKGYRILVPQYNNIIPEEKETTEYINMDSIQSELRAQAEASVGKELGKLRATVSQYITDKEEYISTVNKQCQDRIDSFSNGYEESRKKYIDIIGDLTTKYENLKADKEAAKEEENLHSLVNKYIKKMAFLEKRNWIQRLLNIQPKEEDYEELLSREDEA